MCTPRPTASLTALDQFSLIRSSSSSAIKVRIPIANRPIGVEPSKLSSTDTNRAPASFSRLIDSSASTAERANRSSRATMIPPVSPRSQRASACWNIGRCSLAPDWSISSHHAHDLHLVQLRPVRDLLPLHLRRDERLALTTRPPTHPDIPISHP